MLIRGFFTQRAIDPLVSLSTSDIDKTRLSAGIAYSVIQFNSDGVEYENSTGGSSSPTVSRGNWLDAGTVDQVWIERTIDSGVLDLDEIGSSRQPMTSSYTCYIATATTQTATVTYSMYDAASGGNLLDSQQIVHTATVEAE